ncbi:DUF4062 domain-containing protein [Sphingomonas sp. G-3-2-10]|uniref:DUF4062 domain-containing protein n=1 Tax=Sphingomonas sp. G-3-2-10 TaxID=2728838 RepID=UPI00146F06E2|nr:DUF4062 domain-containing protein [Sphingomonas sp. G-3-2-10]NML06797.1 DUF4062 domain-containing protein [Sphingomonas sp. G-3-2-10]
MAHRPTFFLSSTIYDFRDLRSAIKFSLEARGCRVLASEFNDFGGSLDQHSYEACLTNIEQADYFVLLIGARVGGWYDKPSRISITQQEYRTAYELHRQGKLRLVTFVRSEVWQLKEDRKELAAFLIENAIAEQERQAIASAPSKFANDAEFLGGFIAEVGRNLETGRAVSTGSAKPTGNWIYQFRDFRDIHDVLQPLAFTGLTSEDAAYRIALQNELLHVMGQLLEKDTSGVFDHRAPLRKGLAAHPITVEVRDRGWLTVDLEAWGKFATIFYAALGTRFETVVIDDALTSTIFLDYDAEKGSYVQSAAYEALSKLWSEIRQFNDVGTLQNLSILSETTPRALGRKTGRHDLPADKVALLYSYAQRWINIISLCEALILHLEGRPFVMPELMPFSPIAGYEQTILAGRVSAADLRQALGI